jgi:hypothetical protein
MSGSSARSDNIPLLRRHRIVNSRAARQALQISGRSVGTSLRPLAITRLISQTRQRRQLLVTQTTVVRGRRDRGQCLQRARGLHALAHRVDRHTVAGRGRLIKRAPLVQHRGDCELLDP